MKDFRSYLLSKRFVSEKKLIYYLVWVSQFFAFCYKIPGDDVSAEEIDGFVKHLFDHLNENCLLMSRLIYGGGLRLKECLRLRVKDMDFERDCLIVKSGKGDKDRETVLPTSLKNDLRL